MSGSIAIPCSFYHYCFVVQLEISVGDKIILDKLERGEKICEKDITLDFDDSFFLN